MVLETIIENLAIYVFGSRTLMGVGIIGTFLLGAATFNIDRSSLLLIIAPFVLIAAKTGYLPPAVGILIFIGILILWGIMFKLLLGKE